MLALRTPRRAFVALLGAATLAACSDTTGPNAVPLDAATASARVAPVVAVFQQPAFAAFEGATGIFSPAPAAAMSDLAALTAAIGSRQWDVAATTRTRTTTRIAAAVVPADIRGKTYVYDAAQGAYVVDAAATGAPAAGVRIMLYAWNPLAGAPASPLTRIGYTDLIDESTATTNALRVRLVRDLGNLVLADYAITHAQTASGETFGINGSATNGTTAVNFTLSGSSSGTIGAEKSSLSFNISVPSQGFSVSTQSAFDEVAGTASANVALGYDGHTVTFDLTMTETSASGTVKADGKLYATYTSSYNPATGAYTESFVKADGKPLTGEELQRLEQLFEGAFTVGGFWVGLLWPVYLFA